MTEASPTYNLKECLDNSRSVLITARDLVQDSIYISRRFHDLESLRTDSTSSSVLYVKYRFIIKDSIEHFYMTIGTLISYEKTPEAAERTLELWRTGHNMGFNKNALDEKTKINSLDSILSFGVTSKFVEIRKGSEVIGYILSGRTKNIAFLYNIASNHISHRDHIRLLKERISNLTKFAGSHEE